MREREDRNSIFGRSLWRNFIARIHAEDNSLLNALLKNSPAGEPLERIRWSRQTASLKRGNWISKMLREEVLNVDNSELFRR